MGVHPRIELTDAERASMKQKVLDLIQPPQTATVITRGADGLPRYRLMGGRVADDFTYRLISIRPSAKIDELKRDPYLAAIFHYRNIFNDDNEEGVRFVLITGEAELIETGAGIRGFANINFPHHLDDETIQRTRCGVILHPTLVRVEGFIPGSRYPVYFRPKEDRR
ncbi:MAG: pyridoxamine 5'-phosphate oxidase family protein [Dehalococcoidia bacterium]